MQLRRKVLRGVCGAVNTADKRGVAHDAMDCYDGGRIRTADRSRGERRSFVGKAGSEKEYNTCLCLRVEEENKGTEKSKE